MSELKLVCGQAHNKGSYADKTIAVLMSGGVDSSVCALKLREEGWTVVGVNMIIPLACGGAVETQSVIDVCTYADITLYQLEAGKLFDEKVISHFRGEYQAGRTPNPCCDCNRELKFGVLWDLIEKELGILHLATGHYARVVHEDGRSLLCRGKISEKDQSYFVYGIPARRLPYFHLPLSEMAKSDTRAYAEKAGLPVAQKSESMELCFAGAGDYREALGDISLGVGEFIDSAGTVLGEHTGIENYTPGQRKLGRSFGPEPFYVLQVLPQTNQVVVGPRNEIVLPEVKAHFIAVHQPEKLLAGAELLGKIRSPGDPRKCKLVSYDPDTQDVVVEFEKPVFAPAPGQHLVLYDVNQAVIAGGTIEL